MNATLVLQLLVFLLWKDRALRQDVAFAKKMCDFCELEANHASLHDSRIIHGSEPNVSPLRRCGYTMRFMSTRLRLSESAKAFHRIYLARGRDLANQEYADPTQNYSDVQKYRTAHGKNGH